ncbi:hypothetical protein Pyn_40607 [Prunus yedoensis var. nudiflora]|uniref:Uncharacterized protein n=1 Tax=Prunus yedoensis var. nudiflora TaxID=2094558 RepID=A0A314YF65_PRUYE|nr:hypothetical protein Pyn_40607 [Prunus yedoensis var. nudiflora]
MDFKTTTRACGQEGTEIFRKFRGDSYHLWMEKSCNKYGRFLRMSKCLHGIVSSVVIPQGQGGQRWRKLEESLEVILVGDSFIKERSVQRGEEQNMPYDRTRITRKSYKEAVQDKGTVGQKIRPISPAIRPNQSVRNKSVELTPAPTWGGVFRLEKQIAKEGGPGIEGTSPEGSPHEARGIAESQTTRTLPLVVGRSMEALALVEQLHIAQKEKVYVELKDKGMFKDARRGLSGSEVGPRAISIKAQELGRTEGLPHEFWEKTRSNQDYMLLPTNRPTRHSEFGMGLRNKWVHPKSPTSVPNLFTRFGQNKNKGKGLSRVSPSKFGN